MTHCLSYRVTQLLIQHCLLSKMVYLNIKYVIATRSYEFFIYKQNLNENITLSIVIIRVAAVNCCHRKRYENVASHSLYRMTQLLSIKLSEINMLESIN